jgi:hypothetical protein
MNPDPLAGSTPGNQSPPPPKDSVPKDPVPKVSVPKPSNDAEAKEKKPKGKAKDDFPEAALQAYAFKETGKNLEKMIIEELTEEGKAIKPHRLGRGRAIQSRHWKDLGEEKQEEYKQKWLNGEIVLEEKSFECVSFPSLHSSWLTWLSSARVNELIKSVEKKLKSIRAHSNAAVMMTILSPDNGFINHTELYVATLFLTSPY